MTWLGAIASGIAGGFVGLGVALVFKIIEVRQASRDTKRRWDALKGKP